jgi:hypothetical protein
VHSVVINVPSHSARRERAIKELSSENIKFSWIDAVDGMKMTKSDLVKSTTPLEDAGS